MWYFYIACSALKCICLRSFPNISSYWLSPWATDRLKGQVLKRADQKAPGISLQRYRKVMEVRWISILILKKKSELHYWQLVCSHSNKWKCAIGMPKLGLIEPGLALSNSPGTLAEKLLILQVTCMTSAQINPFTKFTFKVCLTHIFVVQTRLTSGIL